MRCKEQPSRYEYNAILYGLRKQNEIRLEKCTCFLPLVQSFARNVFVLDGVKIAQNRYSAHGEVHPGGCLEAELAKNMICHILELPGSSRAKFLELDAM
jgi:hypothetical protein